MSDPTKPPVTAVTMAHKAPSKASIDTAQDELANLQYKLGRAQVAAMLSAGQAKADKAALADLEKLVAEKRAAVEAMVETFTNPTAPDPEVALAAIRETLGRPGKGATGGIVQPGKSYVIGERSGESIVPASFSKRLDDPDRLDWGNDTVADKGTAVAGVVYETRTGDIVGELRTVQAGDVLVGDGSGTAAPEYVETPAPIALRQADVSVADVLKEGSTPEDRGTQARPPASPKQGDIWAYPLKAAPWAVNMLWDKVSGWSIPLDGDPRQFREARGSDLSADYWEAADLQKLIDQARPRKKLFPLMGLG